MRAALRYAVPSALAIAAVGALGPGIAVRARHHSYFAVREVVVHGERHLVAERVRKIAAIEPGMSIWDVDAAAAEARLRADPWIRSAHVSRQLPGRVILRIRERRPVAIVALRDAPALFYVAAHGHILTPLAAAEPHDFPFLTGLGHADLGGGDAFGPYALRRALALARVAARTPGVDPISEVHVDHERGLTLFLVRPAVPIEVGWGRFAVKLTRLRRVLSRWTGREAELAGLSLLFEDEVIVRTRGTRGAA